MVFPHVLSFSVESWEEKQDTQIIIIIITNITTTIVIKN